MSVAIPNKDLEELKVKKSSRISKRGDVAIPNKDLEELKVFKGDEEKLKASCNP